VTNKFFHAALAALVCANLAACGVKGPPEPPLPSEASAKKADVLEANATVAEPVDAAKDKAKAAEKPKTTKEKEKTK